MTDGRDTTTDGDGASHKFPFLVSGKGRDGVSGFTNTPVKSPVVTQGEVSGDQTPSPHHPVRAKRHLTLYLGGGTI